MEFVDIAINGLVWVVLQGESFVGAVDVFEGCVGRDLQGLVVIDYLCLRHRGEDKYSQGSPKIV